MSDYANLPLELLVEIFRHLSTFDRVASASVCKQWALAFRALSSLDDHGQIVVAFRGDDDFQANFALFARSHHCHLKLFDVNFSYASSMWGAVLPRLASLHLERCLVTERDLEAMLGTCTSLRRLSLVEMNSVFMSGMLLSQASRREGVREALTGVIYFDASRNQYMSDALFNRVTECLLNLRSLVLDGCKIMNHSGIYRKFYPRSQEGASPSVFTFRNLLSLVKSRAEHIQELSFSGTPLDGFAVQELSAVEGLSLISLNLARCTMISQESVLDLARRQKSLEELNLNFCRRVFTDYPATVLSIFQELENIRHLSFMGLTFPPVLSEGLAQLEKLRSLDCSMLDVPSKYLAAGLQSSDSRNHLTSLRLVNFSCSDTVLKELLHPLTHLITLDVTNCQEGMSDMVLQAICQHLSCLENLYLGACRRLTDAGFCGLPLTDSQFKMDENHVKIFLGFKAEANVIKESQIQRQIEHLKTQATGAVRLDSLTRMKVLDVGLTQLSDLSLKTSVAFSDLRSIDLSQCRLVTNEGLIALGENNCHLERVVIRQCAGFDDLGLKGFLPSVRRLRILDLEACINVSSSEVFPYLEKYNRFLVFLNVSFCSHIKVKHVEKLQAQMPMLKHVDMLGLHIAECLEDYGDALGSQPPAPPPVPTTKTKV